MCLFVCENKRKANFRTIGSTFYFVWTLKFIHVCICLGCQRKMRNDILALFLNKIQTFKEMEIHILMMLKKFHSLKCFVWYHFEKKKYWFGLTTAMNSFPSTTCILEKNNIIFAFKFAQQIIILHKSILHRVIYNYFPQTKTWFHK